MTDNTENQSPDDSRQFSITVVYDNYPYEEGLSTGWGFSCLIRGPEKTILFDTGGNGAVLLANMKRLDIDPQDIQIIVISHMHGDHTGGLQALVEQNSDIHIFVPEALSSDYSARLQRAGIRITRVDEPVAVCPRVYSTGVPEDGLKEQSLVIHTGKGLIVITGCAHPGIVNILNTAVGMVQAPVRLVMGGFHLAGMDKPTLTELILQFKRLGVERVGPCHCSGDLTRKMFESHYGRNYVQIGVGRIIE